MKIVTMKAIAENRTIRCIDQDFNGRFDDKRYEILNGNRYCVFSPDTGHQRISRNLVVDLVRHVNDEGLGEILHSPYDLILSRKNVAQPDIIFVRKERSGIIGEINLQYAPDLVIEILSVESRNRDLEIKRRIYAQFGIQEYWVIDPNASTVEVLVWSELGYVRIRTYKKTERLSSPLMPKLRLPLSRIFKN